MVTPASRIGTTAHIDTPTLPAPASNVHYLIGAGLGLGHLASNALQVLRDGAYDALPASLKILESNISTLVGREPVRHQVAARAQERRQGVAEFAWNPIGVTEKAALGIWDAFAQNDGSAAGKQRAGAAAVQVVVLAAPPLNVLKVAKPLPKTTTLYANDLGLGAKYLARVEIDRQPTGAFNATFTHLYDISQANRTLTGIWLYDLLTHKIPDWLTLPRHMSTQASSSATTSAMAQLKTVAARHGHSTLTVAAVFHDRALAGIFKRRYRAQLINTRQSMNFFDGRLRTYTAHIPITANFAARAQAQHRATVATHAISWHGVALAAHDTPLSAIKLPTP